MVDAQGCLSNALMIGLKFFLPFLYFHTLCIGERSGLTQDQRVVGLRLTGGIALCP